MEVDQRIRLWIGRIDAAVGHDLHHVDDLVPAVLVEAELQHVARRVAAGAEIAERPLVAGILVGRLGQRRHQHLARQLAHLALEVGHRLEREIRALRGGEIDLALAKGSKASACAQTLYLPAGSGGK